MELRESEETQESEWRVREDRSGDGPDRRDLVVPESMARTEPKGSWETGGFPDSSDHPELPDRPMSARTAILTFPSPLIIKGLENVLLVV